MIERKNRIWQKPFQGYLHWGIALMAGGIISLDGMIRLPSLFHLSGFWQTPRFVLVVCWMICTVVIGWVLEKPIRYYINQITRKSGIYSYAGLVVVYVCLLFVLYLLFPDPFKSVFLITMKGAKGILLKVADSIIQILILPGILFDLIRTAGVRNKIKFRWNVTVINKYYNHVFTSIFIVATLTPFLISPEINLSGKNTKFWGMSNLMELYPRARFFLGDIIFNQSFARKDNWYVYTSNESLDDYQNIHPFSADDLANIQRKLDHLDLQLASKGIKLLVIIPPNKNTIYPEYLPNQITVIGGQSRLDQLVAYEHDHGEFKVIDIRAELLIAKKIRPVYSECGTHWNRYGAFVAYQVIMTRLENNYPSLKAYSLNDFRIEKFRGDIDLPVIGNLDYSTCTGINLVPIFQEPFIKQKYNDPTINSTLFNDQVVYNITTVIPDSSLPRLLMFRDSFTDFLIPLLSNHFSRAVYLWTIPTNDTFFKTEKPDIVIIEFTERVLKNLLSLPG